MVPMKVFQITNATGEGLRELGGTTLPHFHTCLNQPLFHVGGPYPTTPRILGDKSFTFSSNLLTPCRPGSLGVDPMVDQTQVEL